MYCYTGVMRVFRYFIGILVLLAAVHLVPRVLACGQICGQTADCASCCDGFLPACSYTCQGVSYVGDTGNCNATILPSSGRTCNGTWGSWGPCGGGYQQRWCSNPSDLYQIQSCSVAGSSPAPTPTAPPGCSATTPVWPVPSLTAPANGSTTSINDPTLTWNLPAYGTGCPQTNLLILYIDTVNPPIAQAATLASTDTSYHFTTGSANTRYYWRLSALNGSNFAYSPTWSFVTPGTVDGTVYNDIDGNCSGTAGGFSGMTANYLSDVNSTNYAGAVSSANGTYSITGSPAGYGTLSLTGLPVGYVCSLCSGCTKGSVQSPSITNNFYITATRSGWWQAVGGDVYAGNAGPGVTVKSQLPTSSTRLIIAGGVTDQGALIKASSTAPTLGYGTQISDSQWSATSKYQGKTMNFDFFAANMGLTSSTVDYWSGSSNLTLPPATPVRDFYYNNPAGGEASITTPWTLTGSNSYVFFIDGDLRIAKNIVAPSGTFLAFIVNGDVTIDPTVTAISGLYVMDGQFRTESQIADDLQLTVNGSVVTWGGVNLLRDLGGNNISLPAEKFVYRPDFLVNMPAKMKSFSLNWQEVAPGTFGN